MIATRLSYVRLITACGIGAAALSSCGEAADNSVVVGSGDGSVADASAGAGDAGMRECVIFDEGTTRACSCGATLGTQACLGGIYTACKCAPTDVGSSAGNLCKAGFYSGEFTGKYKPGAFGFGVIPSFFEVDIAGQATGSYPALSFTLSKQEEGSGEFASFSVNGGCMVGSARSAGTDNPFIARITGSLDCRTGMYSGVITGNYNLVSSGLIFNFTGPLSAQFELPNASLSDGVWNVKEPPALTGEPAGGGGGKWSAMWAGDAPPAGADPCAALSASTGAADSGTPDASAPTSDAGAADASP